MTTYRYEADHSSSYPACFRVYKLGDFTGDFDFNGNPERDATYSGKVWRDAMGWWATGTTTASPTRAAAVKKGIPR